MTVNLDGTGKVLEGENEVAITGITAITGIVGVHYFTRNRYKVDAKNGDKGITVASAQEPLPGPEVSDASSDSLACDCGDAGGAESWRSVYAGESGFPRGQDCLYVEDCREQNRVAVWLRGKAT